MSDKQHPHADDRPNPGSDDAIEQGCICAVLDNNHGKFPPFPAGTAWGSDSGAWWITDGCPLHAPSAVLP